MFVAVVVSGTQLLHVMGELEHDIQNQNTFSNLEIKLLIMYPSWYAHVLLCHKYNINKPFL